MTSDYTPQVGDIVDIRGTIRTVHSDGTFDTEHYYVADGQHVTLVERPEPKITVELTRDQIRNLLNLARECRWDVRTLAAADILSEVLDECS